MSDQLKKKILQTIIFYDILNYPLTSFELWKYLTVSANSEQGSVINKRVTRVTLGEIIEALDSDEFKKNIEEYRGFYFLKGRKKLVEQRIQNEKNSIAKFKIAGKVVGWLRFVPFVRMIAVTGTLAMKNPIKDSDIDFFVVLEKGRIWTGRLLVTLAVHLLGKRRHGDKIKNRICLNYFITTGSLEIKRQDPFAANEYSFIYPIFGFNTYQRFGEANIGWIKKYKPNFEFSELKPAKYYVEHSQFSRFIQKAREVLLNFIFGDRIESWLKKKQIARIVRNPLTYKKGGYVEYSDDNLVFLPEPQGEKIFQKFQEKLKNELSPT